MKFILYIILLGLGIAGLFGGRIISQYVDEVFLGMTAPLLVTIFSIFWIEKVFKTDKEKLTATMAKSFFIKMVLFALYFIIILGFYTFEPIPFVISFTGFFILLKQYFYKNYFKQENDNYLNEWC